jgi:hypothetical protein
MPLTASSGWPIAHAVTVAQELRLDDTMLGVLGPGDLGPHASALQTLSMSGSMFNTVSSLCRASCMLHYIAQAPVLAPDAAAV